MLDELAATLVRATRLANSLQDMTYHRAVDTEVAREVEGTDRELKRMMQNIGFMVGCDMATLEDPVESFDSIVSAVDVLLERADRRLDEATGKSTGAKITIQSNPALLSVKPSASNNGKLAYKLIHARNIPRPQLSFADPIDNSPAPFRPRIRVKPNALVPLEESISTHQGLDSIQLGHLESLGLAEDLLSAPNPYKTEIQQQSYPSHVFEYRTPEPFMPLPEPGTGTPTQSGHGIAGDVIWVDTLPSLEAMLKTLEKCKEIAVDLEAHNLRSYQGFTCLMQLSTRRQDFLVDTLKLRAELWRLNDVFTNPSILKVFHGAESDILWLQRDFGVYVVSLFDTYHASKVLGYPAFSLAHLLDRFCGVVADKRYQLADWRIRPLPAAMLHYARCDTHYLLYIYDQLRNELLSCAPPMDNEEGSSSERGMRAVLERCRTTCLRRYEKDRYNPDTGEGPGGWKNLLIKWKRTLDSTRFNVFKALHAWRDQVARDEDESVRYVLPNRQLFALVERLPSDPAGVLGCCHPASPLIRMLASDVVTIIQQAKRSIDSCVQSNVLASEAPQEAHAPAADGEESSVPDDISPEMADDMSEGWEELAAARSNLFGMTLNDTRPVNQRDLGWAKHAPVFVISSNRTRL